MATTPRKALAVYGESVQRMRATECLKSQNNPQTVVIESGYLPRILGQISD